MAETTTVMGSFQSLDRAVEALDRLREVGIPDEDITVVSSVPYSFRAMGRPEVRSALPFISIGGAIAGLLVGIFLAVITPHLYVIRVGGQDVVPTPPTAVLLYELTMLGLILGTFLGVVFLNLRSPKGPRYDGPALTDDRIGLILRCPKEKAEEVRAVLEAQGAEGVREWERRER